MLSCSDAVIGISESWLHEGVPNNFVDVNGYNLERLDRAWGDDEIKTGGGVAVYIRKDLSYSSTNYGHLNVPNIYK